MEAYSRSIMKFNIQLNLQKKIELLIIYMHITYGGMINSNAKIYL